LGNFVIRNSIGIGIAIFAIIVHIYNKKFGYANNFISFVNLGNVVLTSSRVLPMALGIGCVMMLSEIDFSAGRMQGLATCVSQSLLQRSFSEYSSKQFPNLVAPPAIVVLPLAIAIGAFFGAINGVIVSRFKAPSFIATLGTKLMLLGITLWYLRRGAGDGGPISGSTEEFLLFVKGKVTILGISIPHYVFYVIVAAAILWFIWNKTALGKNMHAVSVNPEAARVSGISVIKTTVLAFMISGMFFGFSGFIEAAHMSSNRIYSETDLLAILACLIGGVSTTGGTKKIKNIVIGAFLLVVFFEAVYWLRAPSHLQYLLIGVLIVVSAVVNKKRHSTIIR